MELQADFHPHHIVSTFRCKTHGDIWLFLSATKMDTSLPMDIIEMGQQEITTVQALGILVGRIARSTVHGLSLLILEGSLHRCNMRWCSRWASGL
jgi:hypothetical protein